MAVLCDNNTEQSKFWFYRSRYPAGCLGAVTFASNQKLRPTYSWTGMGGPTYPLTKPPLTTKLRTKLYVNTKKVSRANMTNI